MANTETSLDNLTINELSRAKFEALSTANQLSDTQLYMIRDDGVELIYKGAFSTLTPYYINNVAKYNGGYYICITAVSSTNTTGPDEDTEHWEQLVPSFEDLITVGSGTGNNAVTMISAGTVSIYTYTDGEPTACMAVDSTGFQYVPDLDHQYEIKLPEKEGTLALTSDIPNIVYSTTEPSSPVEGMIWLKPVE